ncbi:MAG: hypothetical protein IKF19_06250 [Bacilli bacterium]|nr:hypothetical protein [Bacilli bacterium]
MEPTKKSVKKNKKRVKKINVLLNDLKEKPNEDNVYKIIKNTFNSRGLKLNNEYIDLLCSLFGDKLIEINNTIRPEYESSEYDDEEDGYVIALIKPYENQKIEIFNVDNYAGISYSQFKETKKWLLNWKEIRFILTKDKEPTLKIIDSNNETRKTNYNTIDMNQSSQDIINEVTSILGNDFLPIGPIRKNYLNSYTKKLKNKDKK